MGNRLALEFLSVLFILVSLISIQSTSITDARSLSMQPAVFQAIKVSTPLGDSALQLTAYASATEYSADIGQHIVLTGRLSGGTQPYSAESYDWYTGSSCATDLQIPSTTYYFTPTSTGTYFFCFYGQDAAGASAKSPQIAVTIYPAYTTTTVSTSTTTTTSTISTTSTITTTAPTTTTSTTFTSAPSTTSTSTSTITTAASTTVPASTTFTSTASTTTPTTAPATTTMATIPQTSAPVLTTEAASSTTTLLTTSIQTSAPTTSIPIADGIYAIVGHMPIFGWGVPVETILSFISGAGADREMSTTVWLTISPAGTAITHTTVTLTAQWTNATQPSQVVFWESGSLDSCSNYALHYPQNGVWGYISPQIPAGQSQYSITYTPSTAGTYYFCAQLAVNNTDTYTDVIQLKVADPMSANISASSYKVYPNVPFSLSASWIDPPEAPPYTVIFYRGGNPLCNPKYMTVIGNLTTSNNETQILTTLASGWAYYCVDVSDSAGYSVMSPKIVVGVPQPLQATATIKGSGSQVSLTVADEAKWLANGWLVLSGSVSGGIQPYDTEAYDWYGGMNGSCTTELQIPSNTFSFESTDGGTYYTLPSARGNYSYCFYYSALPYGGYAMSAPVTIHVYPSLSQPWIKNVTFGHVSGRSAYYVNITISWTGGLYYGDMLKEVYYPQLTIGMCGSPDSRGGYGAGVSLTSWEFTDIENSGTRVTYCASVTDLGHHTTMLQFSITTPS